MSKNRRRPKRHARGKTDLVRVRLPFTIRLRGDLEAVLLAVDPSTTLERWVQMLGGVAMDSVKTWVEGASHTITLTADDGKPLFSYDCTFIGRPGTSMTLDLTLNPTDQQVQGHPSTSVEPLRLIGF